MHIIRSIHLRRALAFLCMLTSMAAWLTSAADITVADHGHATAFQPADLHAEDHIGQDHGPQKGHGDHHCPNCGVHFVAIAQGVFAFAAPSRDQYQKAANRFSALRADTPPTPPPNS